MHRLERLARKLDNLQQRHRIVAILFAINKKFGDDKCGALAAQLTYYGFLTLFPLLLIVVTVLGIIAGGSSSIEHRILHSALAQIPVIGNNDGPLSFSRNIHSLRRDSGWSMAIGILGLLWGSLGSVQNGQYAMAQVWNVRMVDRPGFAPRTIRSLEALGVTAGALALSTALSSFVSLNSTSSWPLRALEVIGTLIVNAALMMAIFRIMTPKVVRSSDLLLGAMVAAVAYTALQIVGALLVGHELRDMSQTYGVFAVVLGALWWIYLVVRVVLYAAEANVVVARRLWPRGIVVPPLTKADVEMLDTYVHQAARRREVSVTVEIAQSTSDPHG
jgi:YihY family inner membrane protein